MKESQRQQGPSWRVHGQQREWPLSAARVPASPAEAQPRSSVPGAGRSRAVKPQAVYLSAMAVAEAVTHSAAQLTPFAFELAILAPIVLQSG